MITNLNALASSTIEHLLQKANCPNCHSTTLEKESEQAIHCSHCQTIFPLLFQRLPILLSAPKEHLTQTYLQYCQHLREEQKKIDQIDQKLSVSKEDHRKLQTLKQAIQTNASILEVYLKEIKNHLPNDRSIVDFIYTQAVSTISYITNFDYLRRDWANLVENDLEIELTCQTILKHVDPIFRKDLLVLGAGAGRVAWELTKHFDEVVAVDNSVTMVSLFYQLQKQNIPFFELNTKNCQSIDQFVRPLEASINSPADRPLHFFVGDALQLPYPAQSVSSLASIFFTDMVPFDRLIAEIKRVLKEEGIFIHFGPLQYHFDDVTQHLTFEEIKQRFQSEGFTILSEASFSIEHCKSSIKTLSKIYQAWILVVQKNKKKALPILQDHSILTIQDTCLISRVSKLGPKGEEAISSTLSIGEKTYDGADSVIDILNLIDGQRNFATLISQLEQSYGKLEEATVHQIKSILYNFIENQSIAVKI